MGFSDSALALLIGIGNYKSEGLGALPATLNDVRELARVLTDPARCAYLHENVSVLTDEAATADRIRRAFKKLAKVAMADSTVLVHFSGHGGTVERRNKIKTYLCPWDADPDHLDRTAISGEEFSDLLSSIKAAKLLVTLDTCHASGSATLRQVNADAWKDGLDDSYVDMLSQGSGRVVMASCKASQFSYNTADQTYGLFTWNLLEGLKGAASVYRDGVVRVLDLYYYVSQEVKSEQPGQEPVLHAKDLDDNFAIALAVAAATPATQVAEVAAIRERIITGPANGAVALSNYLSGDPKWLSTRLKVDTQRERIKKAEDDIDLFGPDPATVVERRRAIFLLLKICSELEDENLAQNY
jgi:uncharacterized caspase-like protein